MISITPPEIRALAGIIEECSGIVLDETKGYLFENRCMPLMEELQLGSFNELYLLVRQPENRHILNRVIEIIATNETSFFRDTRPFEAFKSKILPDLLKWLRSNPEKRPISIWSAACSTGQEVYSLAMAIKECLGENTGDFQFHIQGTDISNASIMKASQSIYTAYEISRGANPDCVSRFFLPMEGCYKVRDSIRSMTSFKKFNLLDSFAPLGLFDIVFCRNVAIYFSMETRKKLFERIAAQLHPHGILIIGATESLIGVTEKFERCEFMNTTYYQLKKLEAAHARKA